MMPSGFFSTWRQTANLHLPAGSIGDPTAGAKVTAALYRLRHGNFSNVEGVGAGVYEYKIDFGPGYRIYFGKDGNRIIILLGGSDKKRQGVAIANAQEAWAAYRQRKKHEGGKQ